MRMMKIFINQEIKKAHDKVQSKVSKKTAMIFAGLLKGTGLF